MIVVGVYRSLDAAFACEGGLVRSMPGPYAARRFLDDLAGMPPMLVVLDARSDAIDPYR